jgi:hypothetical protein
MTSRTRHKDWHRRGDIPERWRNASGVFAFSRRLRLERDDGYPAQVQVEMRAGRAMLTASSDPQREPATSAVGRRRSGLRGSPTFLIRERAAEVVEVIEPSGSDRPAT